MKKIGVNIFFRNGNLIIIALLCIAISVWVDKKLAPTYQLDRATKQAEKYINYAVASFDKIKTDISLWQKIAVGQENFSEFKNVLQQGVAIFLYKTLPNGQNKLVFWNTQQILPPPHFIQNNTAQSSEFVKLSNGHYYLKKTTIQLHHERYVLCAAIDVAAEYFVETSYLPWQFTFNSQAHKYVEISNQPTPYVVKDKLKQPIFYLAAKSTASKNMSGLSICLKLAGLFLLLWFIHISTQKIAKHNKPLAIYFLVGILLLLRSITYTFPELLQLRQFNLFDPSIYGSNIILQSLGDLLINVLLFTWVVLYIRFRTKEKYFGSNFISPRVKAIVGVAALLLFIFSTFLFASIIRGIVADSKISFDVTRFYSLNVNTLIGFVVLSLLSITYYNFSQILFKLFFSFFKENIWLVYFTISALGLLYLTLVSNTILVNFYLWVLLWLLAYTYFVNITLFAKKVWQVSISDMLTRILLFSISIAAIMLVENKHKEWINRKFYAEKLAIQTDPASERLLSIAVKYVDNDYLKKIFYKLKNYTSNQAIRDSLFQNNYSGYLNQYDTRFYFFDENNNALYNVDATSFNTLKTIVDFQAQATTTPGLYYFETGLDKFNYITYRAVQDDNGNLLGALFIVSNPKRFSSTGLLPHVFKEIRKNTIENSNVYAYAIYQHKKLVAASAKYPFATIVDTLPFKNNAIIGKVNNGSYNELWYYAGLNKTIVLAKKRETILESITLFSYLFCSMVFLHFLSQLAIVLYQLVYKKRSTKKYLEFNIRRQIHFTIIFISLFSFIIIGVATISYIKERYNKTNKEKLSRTMGIISRKLAPAFSTDSILHYSSFNDYSYHGEIKKLLSEISEIHGVDVNIYNTNGDLAFTTDDVVYKQGILSSKINPEALYYLNKLHKIEHGQLEKIAIFHYSSFYAPLRNHTGKTIAYISIPYFTSEPEMNEEISNFTVTIINLNAFIFLIAGLIALFITGRITRSFLLISNKMKAVNLSKQNEKIEWGRKDEIGDLVTEYNKMVEKLGISAETLARTEREGAWSEMAKQVAHEIKNPLTPMKLSIQYLQKAIENNHPHIKALTTRVAGTLVEQINHLAKIASDFSQFANIGIADTEVYYLHETLQPLYELYKADTEVNLYWQKLAQPCLIKADKTQMNRLFSNLLSNAKEAYSHPPCDITIAEKIENNTILISITDKGTGIPADVKDKIFSPNFTSKSSGTGLGLAMCKGIVEKANGHIGFTTQEQVGTSFYVSLPIYTEL